MPTFSDFLSFDRLLTPLIIKTLYVLGLITIGLGGIVGFLGAMFSPIGGGFFVALITLLATAIMLIFWRVWIEMVLTFFQIHERLGEIRDRLPRH
jgi:uncharacterized membrane protein